eukprot:9655771-Alexandrium_andersonii.AAC.1
MPPSEPPPRSLRPVPPVRHKRASGQPSLPQPAEAHHGSAVKGVSREQLTPRRKQEAGGAAAGLL